MSTKMSADQEVAPGIRRQSGRNLLLGAGGWSDA